MKRHAEHETPKVIKFNWELLKKYTEGDTKRMLEFFDNVYVRKSENYLYLNPWAARLIKYSSNNSHSYIQNPTGLIEASTGATNSEVYVYLSLVAKRSYFSFVNTKGKMNYVPKWKIDDYEISSLEMNRLLTFDDNNIYLLYEGEL